MLEEVRQEAATTTEKLPTPKAMPGRFVWLWALLGSLLLALLYGRVALLNLGRAVVGGDIDGYENLWNFYWVRHALFDLHTNPFYTSYLYYPTGVSLRFHTLNLLNGLLVMPFWSLFGSVAALNLLFLLSLTLTCFCSYLLLNHLTNRPLAAFVGAAVFTFADEQTLGFYTAGQTNLLAQWWLPLYLLCIVRLVEQPGFKRPAWWWAAAAVGCLVTMALTDWQYVLYAVLVTVLYALFRLSWYWRKGGWQAFLKLGGVGLVWSAVVLPVLVLPMLDEAAKSPYLISSGQSTSHSRALLDFFSLGVEQPGFLALGLILVGLFGWWRQRPDRTERANLGFWLFLMLVFSLISLGPKLIITNAAAPTDIPLPYALLQDLPLLNVGRDPGRFYIVAMLGYSVLLATALGELKTLLTAGANRFRLFSAAFRPKTLAKVGESLLLGTFLAVTLAGFVGASGQAVADPPDWPPFYYQLAQDRDQYAIMELPLFTENGRGEDTYEAYQSIHGKPRLGGRLARDHKLDNPNNFVKRTVLFRDFFLSNQPDLYANLNPARDIMPRTDLARLGLPLLNYYKVRYIIVYLDALQNNELKQIQTLLKTVLGAPPTPVYQDSKMLAYRVPDAPVPTGLLTLDTGNNWHGAESDANGTRRWWRTESSAPGELLALNLSDRPRAASLDCKTASFNPDRSIQVTLNGQSVTTIQMAQAQSLQPFSLKLNLAAGPNVIGFNSPPPYQRAPDGRLLAFMLSDCHLQ